MTAGPATRRELPADDDWHTPAEIATKLRMSVWTVRSYLRDGAMHGHRWQRMWKTKRTVADAALQGLDLHAQIRLCGCDRLRAVPEQRRPRRP